MGKKGQNGEGAATGGPKGAVWSRRPPSRPLGALGIPWGVSPAGAVAGIEGPPGDSFGLGSPSLFCTTPLGLPWLPREGLESHWRSGVPLEIWSPTRGLESH